MRAVADRVGVTPMALYPHVGSRAALLDGMVGQLLVRLLPEGEEGAEGADATEPPADWSAEPADFAHRARLLAEEHPWSVQLLFSRPAITPSAVRSVDRIYTALLAAGLPPSQVPRVERMLSTFVIGHLASEVGGRFRAGTLDPRGRRGQLPEGDLPGHRAVAEWLDGPVDWEAEYEADLDDLRRMIAGMARPGPGQ